MIPDPNQIDSSGEDDKCRSSTETISADQQMTIDYSLNDDNEVFLDPVDDLFIETPTFEEALLDCRRAMAVFFNNDFKEAIRICDKWKDISPIHSITGIMFDAYFTFFTLDKDLLENLKVKLKESEYLLSTLRKQQPISKYFFKPNYVDDFTEEQLYYEFLQALNLLVQFFLTLFSDPTLLSIIKCAFKLKSANSILRNCDEMIKQKGNNWQNKLIKNELIRGFSYVNGGLNIVLSHLPSKVLSILSIIGFGGDRKKGIQGLQKGFEDKTSLFWLYCGIAIMGYNLYAEHILGLGYCDTTWSWLCISDIFKRYPNSLVIYQFMARAYLSTGEPEKGKEYFLKVIESDSLNCKALHNLCNWDLVWCYALTGDFLKAAEVALTLKQNCLWSPATNQYQAAVFTYAHALKTCDKKLMDRAFALMREVKGLKIRFAGRTIPWEKFVITKSEEFLEKGHLSAPVYELYYIWNIFSNVAGKDKYLNLIESDLDKQLAIKSKLINNPEEPLDEYCLLLNLKSCVLRNKYEYRKAIDCLRQIFKHESRIMEYNYIMPNAFCDLGISYYLSDNFAEAKKYLHSARADYSGYLAETMVHFRIHNTLLCIKSKELKLSGLSSTEQNDADDTQLSNANEIAKIKTYLAGIENNLKSKDLIDSNNNENLVEIEKSTTKLGTIEEENMKNLSQDIKYDKKAYLDYSTRSKSEANLFRDEIEFKSMDKKRNLKEINVYPQNYLSNPQINNQYKKGRIDNEYQIKELVNELGTFKERLVKKQRKNSLLKRVKSLSKINFTKNLQSEMLKDEIEFDLQKNQKSCKKKHLFRRRISGIF